MAPRERRRQQLSVTIIPLRAKRPTAGWPADSLWEQSKQRRAVGRLTQPVGRGSGCDLVVGEAEAAAAAAANKQRTMQPASDDNCEAGDANKPAAGVVR